LNVFNDKKRKAKAEEANACDDVDLGQFNYDLGNLSISSNEEFEDAKSTMSEE
jgi:hypothetical protein